MAKTPPVGIRLNPAERTALDSAAAAEDRTISALGRKIIAEWLGAHGWLHGPSPPAKAKPCLYCGRPVRKPGQKCKSLDGDGFCAPVGGQSVG